jgi:hypothetical protein
MEENMAKINAVPVSNGSSDSRGERKAWGSLDNLAIPRPSKKRSSDEGALPLPKAQQAEDETTRAVVTPSGLRSPGAQNNDDAIPTPRRGVMPSGVRSPGRSTVIKAEPVETSPVSRPVVNTTPVEESSSWEEEIVEEVAEDERVVASPVKRKKKGGRPTGGVSAPNAQSTLVTASNDWDDDNPAFLETDNGGGSEKAKTYVSESRNIRITPRDINIIRFLARFRYAQGVQIARYIESSQKATDQRLTKLGKAGLLRREDVTRGQSLWTPTAWGLSTADLDFRAIGEGKISYVTIAHTLGLVNVGIELEIGGENLLGLDQWGEESKNRRDLDGLMVPGETLVTERDIRQSEQRWKKDLGRQEIERAYPLALAEWLKGDRSQMSPELEVGNEAMFIMHATRSGMKDHVPDLVVARQRNQDGTPGSFAIELELNSKPVKEWTRILKTFSESNLYSHLYYFTHKKSIADTLLKIAGDVGMGEDRFSVKRYNPAQGNLPFWG